MGSRIARLVVGVIFASGIFGLVGATSAESQQGVIAQASVILPPGEMIFRFIDLVQPAGQPAVTHMHFAGFTYAVEGSSTVSLDGKETTLAQGQGIWIPAQATHTHGAVVGSGSHFWFVAVTPVALRGLAPVWPYPNAHIIGDTASFTVADTSPRTLTLSEVRLANPGDTVASPNQNGPTGVAVIEGQVTVGGQALAAGGTTMQPQSGTDTYMNTGTSAARLLVLSVAPAAAASPPAAPAQASATPPSAPPTGGGGEANFVRRLGDG
jgi:quercetin dioxygenase-like cupin family protein